ncbi:hypothetical protein QAD02_022158 [Eretmocerus hayati]|uniref:Uncharacterized protein n=1 Tax=Eretmocerus hayati TaxID=131215 RepID=A0ACC2PRZ2_9HYME|nr:hypothetical protein QAD02_022158 [Eretmocerus hayati]
MAEDHSVELIMDVEEGADAALAENRSKPLKVFALEGLNSGVHDLCYGAGRSTNKYPEVIEHQLKNQCSVITFAYDYRAYCTRREWNFATFDVYIANDRRYFE